jgi:AcrR family transcriptional regulator
MTMPLVSPARARRAAPRRPAAVGPESRFDRRLSEILAHATDVFDQKGYAGASMRDLSRASGMSLAGMYYYVESKERLLYLIQKHTFATILGRLKERLRGVSDPAQSIRIFILNHLQYFLANPKAMKVLSHEDDALTEEFAHEVAGVKREYYRICLDLVEKYQAEKGIEFNSRIAVLSLFGMMNWIYTWHNPRYDGNAPALAGQMGDIFLKGISAGNPSRRASRKKPPNGKEC